MKHQELISLADAESSLGVARILNSAPASTEYGLAVRQVDYSTTAQVSSVGGVVSVAQNSTVWQVQVGGYSTTVNVSSLAGKVTVDQNSTAWVTQARLFDGASVALVGSTAAPATGDNGLVVRQVGFVAFSTTVNVSSLAGAVTVRSSAADALVTAYQSTYTDFHGLMRIGDRDQSTQVANVTNTDPASTAWALAVRQVGATPGSTVMTVSTGSVRVHQSTAADLNVTVAGYSTTVNVSSLAGKVLVDQNSTVWVTQARLFDGASVALVGSTTAPATGDNGLVVRQVGFVAFSTVMTVSTGSVRVHQSTAGDLLATVTPSAGSTWSVRPLQSSQADLRVTVYQSTVADLKATVAQNSTVWAVQAATFDGTGNALESSTSAPSTGARGLVVRQAVNGINTYAASTTGQSSATTLVSSNAANKAFVFAYSITSTLAGPVQWGFYSGSTLLWTGVLAAPSSAISGANLAVSPPGFLFKGSTGQPLTFNCASSNTGLSVSVAYWQST